MEGADGNPVARITWPATVELAERPRPHTDAPAELPVLLVDFVDRGRVFGRGDFDDLLFGAGPGSMANYYSEVSYGQLGVDGSVSDWYRMDESLGFYRGDSFGIYGEFPHNSQGLVVELVRRADPDLDFSRFDRDRDGMVDGLMVVHAGPGAEETGSPADIWSHKWQLSDPAFGSPGPVQTADGVSVDVYSIQPERFEDGRMTTIGVFCHEYGHILGLPDLYDTDYSSSGIGRFCLMAAGSWGQAAGPGPPGSSPVHPCAWCKYHLGWTVPDSLELGLVDSLSGARLTAAASASECYRLLANPGGTDWGPAGTGRGEYFMVENRHRAGFDAGLPGDGLLILHVDESQPGNDDDDSPLVGILQADGSPSPVLPAGDRGTADDLWRESDTGVTGLTVPSTAYRDGVQSGAEVKSISGAGPVMTADLGIRPLFLGRVYSYPNPVVVADGTAQATIAYQPTEPDRLAGRYPAFVVRIYDVAADPVRVLDREPGEVNREHRAAYWDLTDDGGRPAASGMYFYTIEIDEDGVLEQNTGRLTIVR